MRLKTWLLCDFKSFCLFFDSTVLYVKQLLHVHFSLKHCYQCCNASKYTIILKKPRGDLIIYCYFPSARDILFVFNVTVGNNLSMNKKKNCLALKERAQKNSNANKRKEEKVWDRKKAYWSVWVDRTCMFCPLRFLKVKANRYGQNRVF